MLTNKIQEVEDNSAEPGPTDLFEQSLFTIFSDSRNQHGEPGQYVIYKSPVYGDIKLRLADPDPSNHSLFSHFAALQAAELITDGQFDVRSQTVLELGAGAGLPGIISVLSGAEEVIFSDYPAPEILKNISHNLDANLPPELLEVSSVAGHVWGNLSDDLCSKQSGRFTRVIAADCFWMGKQHDNLSKSIVHLMARGGILLAIAGFHTGRAKVAAFFDSVERAGLELVGPIVERDVEGNQRSWERDRGAEDPVDRKRWLVIGLFRHKEAAELINVEDI